MKRKSTRWGAQGRGDYDPATVVSKIDLMNDIRRAGHTAAKVAEICGVKEGTADNWMRTGNGKLPNDENFKKLKEWFTNVHL